MNYPQKASQKPSVSSDAWAEIEAALALDPNPSPDREVWSLIAEQERLRLHKVLSHRLVVYGARRASS